ncbi:MAG: 3-oxoacyl-(acyl-carrier-protein) synthase 2 [Syntrophorhabdus sp. PtaU1.Bin153]|nr:MAG: 3-oxoacyl-(acyl-carrier-protein) synthase 2 [Syntrophorhabdus sp. PtaU1.Bin153]
MGLVTSLGIDLAESWTNLVAGKSGIRPITLFDASGSHTRIAGEVNNQIREVAKQYISKRNLRQMTRLSEMTIVCARQAIEDSQIDLEKLDKDRTGVIIGATNSGYNGIEKNNSTHSILKGMLNSLSAWISLQCGFKGPNFTVTTACSSASYGIGIAYDMIKSGTADLMVAGGSDTMISEEGIGGFNELLALSESNHLTEKASRPFDKNRDGFVMGEGGGIMILESLESAQRRGAKIYCELGGYGIASESYNILAPEKDGEGMARTMGLALRNSGVNPEEVQYINAHGTSTTLNDLYETRAIKKVFGDLAYKIPISSSKSMIGHTLGAAGGIEAVITAKTIHEGIITPTINYETPDPDCDLDYVPNQSRKCCVDVAISNSFAFGGHNATLVLRKHRE